MNISKERLEVIAYGSVRQSEVEGREMARYILELQKQEPVAWQWFYLKQWHVTNDEERARDVAWGNVEVLPLYAAPVPTAAIQPPAVPDNVVTAEHRRVIEMLLKVCGCAFEMMDDGCQMEVDGEPSLVVPYEAAIPLSDALDEIENSLPDQDDDRPNIVLTWSAVPRTALKSLLQLSGNSEQAIAYPDKLPCDVLLVPGLKIGKGCSIRTLHGALLRRSEFVAMQEAMSPEDRHEQHARITAFMEECGIEPKPDSSPAIQDGCEPHRITPIQPERDAMGFWIHPDRLETPFDEGGAATRTYAAWFAERGMEVDFTYMNQVFCDDCVYGENVERPALHWNPESPYGEGWILTAIFDTEDGPCAEWVRYKDGDA